MRFGILALLALGMAVGPAAAQVPSSPASRRPAPDFYFGRPSGAVALRGSWLFSRAGSDWYDFVTDQLTLKKRDFNQPGIAADVDVTLTDRLDAVVGVEFSRSSTPSEYRRLVDNNRQPINQDTRMGQASFTGGVKFALRDRGRSVSSLAWIPRAVTPYVTGGGGVLWFSLSQTGDFVDFVDLSVFPDVFQSQGWTPTAYAGGGVDLRVARRLFTTVDARYRWASGTLSRQWVDFDPVDLSGLRISAGITVPF